MAEDRLRRQHADLRPDRLRQDPERVPVGDRRALAGRLREPRHPRKRGGAGAGLGFRGADRLHLPAQGPLLRHRAQPARTAEGNRRGDLGRVADRRHAAEGAPGDAADAARRPDHDPGVALSDHHLAGARDPHRGRGRDRRRDPRGRPIQARLPSRAHPRAALAPGHRAGKPRAAEDRALRDSAPARPDRDLPGRAAARVRDRRRRGPQAARPRDRRPRRRHDGARRGHRPAASGRAARCCPAASPDRIDPGPIEASLDPAANPRSIWPAIYPELLELVRAHTSTIIFVNNRRGAERLAKRLNELHNNGSEPELPATEQAGNSAARVVGRRRSATGPARRQLWSFRRWRVRRDRPRPPRLTCSRGAPRRRGAAQVGQAALPGRDLVARARHRHGRCRPGDPGRVAEVGRPRPAASRPRRPPAR